MQAERWQRVKDLFDEAMRTTADEQLALIEHSCAPREALSSGHGWEMPDRPKSSTTRRRRNGSWDRWGWRAKAYAAIPWWRRTC